MNSFEENKLPSREVGALSEHDGVLLAVFKEEIKTLKANEIEARKQKKDSPVNLLEVNSDELTLEDMKMYEAVGNYAATKVSPDAFEKYRGEARASGNKSRADFAGYLANKLSAVVAWSNLHDLHE